MLSNENTNGDPFKGLLLGLVLSAVSLAVIVPVGYGLILAVKLVISKFF